MADLTTGSADYVLGRDMYGSVRSVDNPFMHRSEPELYAKSRSC